MPRAFLDGRGIRMKFHRSFRWSRAALLRIFRRPLGRRYVRGRFEWLQRSNLARSLGRRHSDRMRLRETFHRADHDHPEWTVTLTDPMTYTQPW